MIKNLKIYPTNLAIYRTRFNFLKIGLLSFYSIFLTVSLSAQEEPSISTCDGVQRQCLTGPITDICVNINLNGFNRPIDRFEIKWGDDSEMMVIPFGDAITNISHTYDLTDFFFSCKSSNGDFGIRLDTYVVGEESPVNNGFFPTFLNPPRADFEITNTICVGSETCLDLRNACPTNNYKIVNIDYGDGQTDTLTCHTYDRVGTYTVSLTLENSCGTNTKTQTINVIEEPVATAFSSVSGTANNPNPYQICVGTQVNLDGDTLSQNESSFRWRILNNSGFTWRRDDMETENEPTIPDIGVIFNQEGTYTIVLEVNNACNLPDLDTLVCEVIDASAFTLNEQDDGCMSLEYSPKPIEDGVIYEVDGVETSNFPVILGAGQHTVKATNPSNICVAGSLVDTFTVFAIEKARIMEADTTICSVDGMLQLSSTPANAEWRINGELFNGIINPDEVAEGIQIITYGLAPCITPDTIRIEVIQAGIAFNGNTAFCLEDFPASLMASPTGGIYTGVGITDSLQGIFDPQLAGVGKHTIYYQLANDDLPTCSSFDSIIIDVATLTADFVVASCDGLSLSFALSDSSTTNFDNIEWDFGDGATSNNSRPNHPFPSAQSYTVSVTIERNGCQATATRNITIEEPPNALFAIDNEPTNCAELTVTINDNSTGSNLIYLWDFGNGDTSSISNPPPIIYDAIENDTIYRLSLTVQNDCAIDNFTIEIPVKARAKARFGTRFDRYCSGEKIEMSNNATGSPISYQWLKNGRQLSTDSMPPTVQHLTEIADSIEICLVVENQCGIDTVCKKILIEPTNVKAFFNTEDSTACVGEPFCFTNFSNTNQITFDFGDGTKTDSINFCHTYAEPGIYPVVLKAFGCGFDSLKSALVVYSQPAISLQIPPIICPKTKVQLSVIAENSDAIKSYHWQFDDSLQMNTSIITRQFDTTRTYAVDVSVTSIEGCTQKLKESIPIATSPIANFSINDTVFCEMESVILTRENSSNESCFYMFGDGNTSNNCVPIHAYEKEGIYKIKQIITNDLTCTDTLEQVVIIRALPAPNFEITNQELCHPAEVHFQNLTPNAESYEWQFGNGDSSVLNNPIYTYPTAGTFSVTLTAINNGQCLATIERPITIAASPIAAISLDEASICANQAIEFTTQKNNNTTTVQWDFDNEKVSFEPTTSTTYEEAGVYTIQLIHFDGACSDTAEVDLTVEAALNFEVNRSPILCNGAATGVISLDNRSGTAPFAFNWSNGANEDEIRELLAGNYQVTVTDVNLCRWTEAITLSEPTTVQATIVNQQNIDCFGEATGSLEIMTNGGTPNYQLDWSNGSQLNQLQNLVAGVYILTITDANDCQTIAPFSILQNEPIEWENGVTNVSCFGAADGEITLATVVGGAGDYLGQVTELEEATGTFFNNLSAGVYSLEVTDKLGCKNNFIATIQESAPIYVQISEMGREIRQGTSIPLTTEYNVANPIFQWTPIEGLDCSDCPAPNAQPLVDTEYIVKIQDENGCTAFDSIPFTVEIERGLAIPDAFSPDNDGYNDRFFPMAKNPGIKTIQSFQIFDRWGGMLYEATDFPVSNADFGWNGATKNGTPVQPGTYIYQLVIEYIDGEILVDKGSFLLIR